MKKSIGAILAGGQSERMGAPKAAMTFGAASFFERVQAALEPFVDEVIILGQGAGCPENIVRLADPEGLGGPVAGLAALSQYLRRPSMNEVEGVFIAPCDMPLLTRELVALLKGDPARSAGFFTGSKLHAFPLYLSADALRDFVPQGSRWMKTLNAFNLRPVPLPSREAYRLSDINTPTALENALRADLGFDLFEVTQLEGGKVNTHDDALALEEPLEIRIGGIALATLMRTPGNDLELVRGFLLSEGIVQKTSDIARLAHCLVVPSEEAEDNVIDVRLAQEVDFELADVQRHFFASSSCGVCGKATIENVMKRSGPLAFDPKQKVSAKVLGRLPERLRSAQGVFARTGGVHAAGLFDFEGRLITAREDVGRHNAADKVFGFAADAGIDVSQTILQVSGRVSFEIVQKALALRVPVVSAISAPTSLAVKVAAESGMVLAGFVRGEGQMNVYAGKERVVF